MGRSKLKVLMVTSEVVPFAKAGGLGDMVGALAPALAALGHDVRIVVPRYYAIPTERLEKLEPPLGVPLAGAEEWCAVYRSRLPGSKVPVYFLDHQGLFGRDGIYGTRAQPAFPDNLRRFALLSRGALQLARMLGFIPDVVHCHDWPSAVVPVYLQTLERSRELKATASVLTIHNLGYQGVFLKEEFPHLGLPWEQFHGAGFEHFDQVNLLQAGLHNAELLTTVSPTYAREIQTPAFGFDMDGLLRHRAPDLFGVLNGIDYEIWDPETDPMLPLRYSAQTVDRKTDNKVALQRELGLEVDPAVPLYGIISRLVEQKGFGELCGPTHGRLYDMCHDLDLQFVVLGTGERWCEEELTTLAGKLPNLAVRLEYNDRLAHLIEAASDFFLMPSRYEPCGLNQMYSLRYGALPIVRRTGGLADTVESYDEATGEGTGFVFDQLTPGAIYDTVGWALWAYHHRPEHVLAMRRRAMTRRFAWDESAQRYLELYRGAMDRRLGRVPRTW